MALKYSEIIAGVMSWGAWGKQFATHEMNDLMHFCIDNGITTFDHADIYGGYTTEAAFGDALVKSGINRNNIQLISKCGIQLVSEPRTNTVKHYNYNKDYIIASVECSLKNLHTDYLDLLLLHRPSPLMQVSVISEAIHALKTQGKIKQFGVSNFTSSQLKLISNDIPIAINQIEFSLTAHTAMYNGLLDNMIIDKIKPMAWSPLGSIFKDSTEQTRRINKVLDVLEDKYEATKSQLLLSWIAKHPSKITPVIGTANKSRILDAVASTKISLELEDWFSLLAASQGHEVP